MQTGSRSLQFAHEEQLVDQAGGRKSSSVALKIKESNKCLMKLCLEGKRTLASTQINIFIKILRLPALPSEAHPICIALHCIALHAPTYLAMQIPRASRVPGKLTPGSEPQWNARPPRCLATPNWRHKGQYSMEKTAEA